MTDVVVAVPTEDSPENGGDEGPLAYGRVWFERVTDELEARGIPYVLIEGDNVTRETVVRVIREEDPRLVMFFGHGFRNVLTGDYSEREEEYPMIFAVPGRVRQYGYTVSLDNVGELDGTTCYTLSCNTAQELLPEAVGEGAHATAGYDDEFIWMVSDAPPRYDRRAEPFGEAGTEFAVALAQGRTVDEARERTVQKYNKLIDEYRGRASLMDREAVKWLTWDRDHFKTFGSGSERPVEAGEYQVSGKRQAAIAGVIVLGVLAFAYTFSKTLPPGAEKVI